MYNCIEYGWWGIVQITRIYLMQNSKVLNLTLLMRNHSNEWISIWIFHAQLSGSWQISYLLINGSYPHRIFISYIFFLVWRTHDVVSRKHRKFFFRYLSRLLYGKLVQGPRLSQNYCADIFIHLSVSLYCRWVIGYYVLHGINNTTNNRSDLSSPPNRCNWIATGIRRTSEERM